MKVVTVPTDALMEMIRLQLEKGGKANLTVTGSSMLPMLREHIDSVILAPAERELKPGDIALYQSNSGYILHRVIRTEKERYLFCGDNQCVTEAVPKEQVLAVVTAYTKRGKFRQLTDPGYCMYKAVWVHLFGFRKYYIALRRWLGRLRRGK